MPDPRDDFLHALPQLIADRILLALPGLKTCEKTAGRFNLERLNEKSIRAPAVLVSVVGLKQHEKFAGPLHGYMLDMAAFVVTKDAMGLGRDEAAAAITQVIAGLVPDQRWGQNQCGEARDVVADPIVTSGFRKSATSLWAVTWKQPCTLKPIAVGETIAMSIYLGREPDTGLGNEDEYDLVAGEPSND